MRNMSTGKSLDLSGIYPPLSTPFTASEEIDWEQLASNIQKYNNIGFRGYVVQGSNGEYIYLSKEERVQVVRRVRELAPREKLIMAGSGCESTRDTIEMSNKMADAGADCVLVVTPFYYKSSMTADAMLDHYTKVADASKVPVILYSIPANTGMDLPADVIINLSQHPNIIGMKESGGNITKIGSILYGTRNQDFQLLAGSAGFLLAALTEGCVGGVCALADILGDEVCELFNLHQQGKHEEARQLQLQLTEPNIAVSRQFGIPGLKAVMDWFGYYGGPVRAPLQPLNDEQLVKIKAIFRASGFQPAKNGFVCEKNERKHFDVNGINGVHN